jgi:hypothetical protein
MAKLENEYSVGLLESMLDHGVEYCSEGLRDCDTECVVELSEQLKFLKQEQDRIVDVELLK